MTTLSPEVRSLFEAPDIAHVATLLDDGSPHTVPVWVGVEDGQIAMLTSPRSRKARNLTRDPRTGDLDHRPPTPDRDGERPRPRRRDDEELAARLAGSRSLPRPVAEA